MPTLPENSDSQLMGDSVPAGDLAPEGRFPNAKSPSAATTCPAVVHGKFLPDNPTQFDYLHAIRAIASRISNKQIFDLADAAMNLPNVNVEARGK